MLLDGVRILELGSGLASSFAARILADLGAEVVKIEPPCGDPLRRVGPFWGDDDIQGSALFGYLNAGKQSVTLDWSQPSGADLLKQLWLRHTVVIESASEDDRSGTAVLLARMRAAAPATAVVSITTMGLEGPLADAPASGLTVQHLSGFAHNNARSVLDTETQSPVGGADHEQPLSVGICSASSALWALMAAEAGTSPAPHVDLSAFDFLASSLSPDPLGEWNSGERSFERVGRAFKGAVVAGGLVWALECKDGWVMVSPREQHQWERWVDVLGHPAWADDPALCGDRQTRRERFIDLFERMCEWSRVRSKTEVFAAARSARVACFPISTMADILANAQLRHRQFFNTLNLGDRSIPVPGLPVHFETTAGTSLPHSRQLVAPLLGDANARVFGAELGLGAPEIERLRSAATI
jgi:crotonobetainyl-CoA:carnitine CoA-transferase CaiB-like acyl-CoA transferase